MPYDRISAMGVQHGLLSPVDEANMEAARQQAAMQLQQYMADKAERGQSDAAQIAADASKYAHLRLAFHVLQPACVLVLLPLKLSRHICWSHLRLHDAHRTVAA